MVNWLDQPGIGCCYAARNARPGSYGCSLLPLVRMLMIPGHTNIWVVFYPVVPWLGATGMGLLFGELLEKDAERAGRMAGWTGLGLLVLFVILRAIGGFGNLNEVPPGRWVS